MFLLFLASVQEQDILEAIIGKLLNLGKLQEARQLVALFDYNSRELTLVLVSAWEGRGGKRCDGVRGQEH